MRVHWTANAKQRLRKIQDYIAEDNPKTARATIQNILSRSQQIGTLPYSGRCVPEYDREDIREMLGGCPRIEVVARESGFEAIFSIK